MAKEQALAVLGVADTVVHQVPVHAVRAGITRMTAVAALPVLEAVGGVVEVAFSFVFIAFFVL